MGFKELGCRSRVWGNLLGAVDENAVARRTALAARNLICQRLAHGLLGESFESHAALRVRGCRFVS